MCTVKVIVYYMGRRFGQEELNVDSAKDAIIKTVCVEGYPKVYKEGATIRKISVERFNSEKVKEQRKFAIHTVKKSIDLATRETKIVNEYWLV